MIWKITLFEIIATSSTDQWVDFALLRCPHPLRISSRNAVDTICITVEDYCQDFVHLRNRFYDNLLDKAQERIVKEYLKALFAK